MNRAYPKPQVCLLILHGVRRFLRPSPPPPDLFSPTLISTQSLPPAIPTPCHAAAPRFVGFIVANESRMRASGGEGGGE